MPLLSRTMLDSDKMRQYVIDTVKAPLKKLIIKIGERYPEPTRDNCTHPNVQIMFDIWDEFKERDKSEKLRSEMFDTIFKVFICEYEHDPYYRDRIDWIMWEALKREWTFYRKLGPSTHWKPKREYNPFYVHDFDMMLSNTVPQNQLYMSIIGDKYERVKRIRARKGMDDK